MTSGNGRAYIGTFEGSNTERLDEIRNLIKKYQVNYRSDRCEAQRDGQGNWTLAIHPVRHDLHPRRNKGHKYRNNHHK